MISDISLVKRKAAHFVQTLFGLDFIYIIFQLVRVSFLTFVSFQYFLRSISYQSKSNKKVKIQNVSSFNPTQLCNLEMQSCAAMSCRMNTDTFWISYLNFALAAIEVMFFLGHMWNDIAPRKF